MLFNNATLIWNWKAKSQKPKGREEVKTKSAVNSQRKKERKKEDMKIFSFQQVKAYAAQHGNRIEQIGRVYCHQIAVIIQYWSSSKCFYCISYFNLQNEPYSFHFFLMRLRIVVLFALGLLLWIHVMWWTPHYILVITTVTVAVHHASYILKTDN